MSGCGAMRRAGVVKEEEVEGKQVGRKMAAGRKCAFFRERNKKTSGYGDEDIISMSSFDMRVVCFV